MSGAVLDFLANRIDIFAVGLFLDATSLGYYYLLKRVLQAAVGATIYPPWSIMMPALRRLLGDWGRFNRAYTSLVAVAHACWVLLIAALCSSAPNLLPTVLARAGSVRLRSSKLRPCWVFRLRLQCAPARLSERSVGATLISRSAFCR